ALVQEVANQGKDLGLFCRSMMEYLRNLLMVKVSRNPEKLLNTHTCDLSVLKKQAEGFHTDELQQMFTILSRAETEMKRSSLGQMVFEMAILRLTETRPFKNIDDLIYKINQAESEFQPVQSAIPKPAVPVPKSNSDAPSAKAAPPLAQPDNGSFDSTTWTRIRQEVSRKRPAFEHYLDKCQVLALNENEIKLMFSDSFTLEMVESPENVKFIKDMVQSVSGHDVQVVLKLGEAKPTPSLNTQEKKKLNDENQGRQKTESEIIQDALDIFGGTVVK
ncbi:MAG: DNA polymerase III subunit gamma/tau, partial [Nitrospinae bacterium]|nr:DNA polymerase III subunit gamma/tau [Nitrospinota bacterium]